LAFSYFESHFLTFNQSTTTSTVDSAEVNENVFAAFTLDETKTFILPATFELVHITTPLSVNRIIGSIGKAD